MRAASVTPVWRSRALFNSPASTVVLSRMRFMPQVCHVLLKVPFGFLFIHRPARSTGASTFSSRMMIAELDREATRLGVTRQSLIKVWIAEKLDQGDHPAASRSNRDLHDNPDDICSLHDINYAVNRGWAGREIHRSHHIGEEHRQLLVLSRAGCLREARTALTYQLRVGQSTATISAG